MHSVNKHVLVVQPFKDSVRNRSSTQNADAYAHRKGAPESANRQSLIISQNYCLFHPAVSFRNLPSSTAAVAPLCDFTTGCRGRPVPQPATLCEQGKYLSLR
jgi:hypothetical protein